MSRAAWLCLALAVARATDAQTPAKPAAAASTPESRSAAALALSHEPTFDEGTAKRIKEAALSYSDLAVRGGWPTIPSDAKFALGVQGAHDELLRKRLIITEDLAARILRLPTPIDLTEAELDRVAGLIAGFLGRGRRAGSRAGSHLAPAVLARRWPA